MLQRGLLECTLKVEEVPVISTDLMIAVYAVPARVTQGVWMEFQKRLYTAQEDKILDQRRKETYEAAKRVDRNTKDEILKRWANILH